MNENWNPEIPLDLQQNFKKEKEQAFTLYLDFVVDETEKRQRRFYLKEEMFSLQIFQYF